MDFENIKQSGEWILFTSYAPGTGKTYAMINFSVNMMSNHTVAWGIINDSYRRYDEIKNNKVIVLGKICDDKEFAVNLNINDILDIHPNFVVIDEMVYRNVCTGNMLYEDIETIVSKGISVISSCNMQVFHEVAKQCKEIAGISVRKPIPDYYYNYFSSIYFIDSNPEDVAERYRAGLLFPSKTVMLDKYLSLSVLQEYRKIIKDYLISDRRVVFLKNKDIGVD